MYTSKRSRKTLRTNYDFLFFVLELLFCSRANVSNSTLVSRAFYKFYNTTSPFAAKTRSYNSLKYLITKALRSLQELGLINISYKNKVKRSITINNAQTAIPVLQSYFKDTPTDMVPQQIKHIVGSKPIGKSYEEQRQQYNDFQELLNIPGEQKLSQQQQKQAFSYFIDAIRKFNCSTDTIIASRALYTNRCLFYKAHPRSIFNWLKNLTFDDISLMHNNFLTLEPMVLRHHKTYQGEDGFKHKAFDDMIISEASENIDTVYYNLERIESYNRLPHEFKNWRCLMHLISNSTQRIKQKILDIFICSVNDFYIVYDAFASASKTYKHCYA